MSEEAPRRGVIRSVQRFLVFLCIVALAGAVVWLLSVMHSRTYALELRDGELRVLRGREMPTGYVPYLPTDRLLAQAYAPIPLMGELPGDLAAGPFDDRDALDQALFRTLKAWIDLRMEAEDPERRAQSLRLLKRLELLSGLSAEQREQREQLQGKVAFLEGRTRLEEAEVALRDAVARLRLAAQSNNRHAREAGDLLERTAGLADQLTRAVRLSGPARTADRAEQGPAAQVPSEAAFAPPISSSPQVVAEPPPPVDDDGGRAPQGRDGG